MNSVSAYLPWVCALAGLLLFGAAGCGGNACGECRTTKVCTTSACLRGTCTEFPIHGDSCNAGKGICQNGVCQPNLCIGVDCDDEKECTADACDPSNGKCAHMDLDTCNAGLGMCEGDQCVTPGVEGCGSPSHVFADGDFAGTWTSREVEGRSEGMRSFEVSTVSPGGNLDDGAYHRVEATLDGTMEQAGIWVAHALDGAFYDPSAPSNGEICGLRVFLDGTDQFDDVASRSSFFSVFLLQNDTYYWGDRFEANTGMWETHAWTTTTDDFVWFDGPVPGTPNFSASGAPIQFGYLTGSSGPEGLDKTTTVAGADNFRVEIYPPEP